METLTEPTAKVYLLQILLLLISVIPTAAAGSDFHWEIRHKELGSYICTETFSTGRTKKFQKQYSAQTEIRRERRHLYRCSSEYRDFVDSILGR